MFIASLIIAATLANSTTECPVLSPCPTDVPQSSFTIYTTPVTWCDPSTGTQMEGCLAHNPNDAGAGNNPHYWEHIGQYYDVTMYEHRCWHVAPVCMGPGLRTWRKFYFHNNGSDCPFPTGTELWIAGDTVPIPVTSLTGINFFDDSWMDVPACEDMDWRCTNGEPPDDIGCSNE